jgi:putative exosortase-associated protein (TIGR04073 family)
MKKLVVISLLLGLVGSSLGDIQDPPSNDYGPTRKLGRGL